MRKRLLFTTLAVMMAAIATFAVPAKPGLKKKVTLKNGSTVELTLKGDEHFSYYTDAAGKPCLIEKGVMRMLTNEEVKEKWTALKQKRMEVMEVSQPRRAANRVGKPSKTTTGTQRGLVILVEFADVKFVTPNPKATFMRFFNEEGYNEDGNAGSVRDYFKEQSYGKLTIDFDVVGPYTTKREMKYYGKPYTDESGNEQHDTHAPMMAAEAVDSAFNDGVDFSKYDWDKDGEVDQVFIIYAGYAEAQGADENTIWPHEWVLAAENATKKHNGVTINTYGCTAELRGNGKPNKDGKIDATMDGIGTACHEFSHCLGLPDMYDTTGDNYGMAYWDVMCAGSYNQDSRIPAGYTSYERWYSNWMEPTELKEMTRIDNMKPLVTNAEAYVLYNEKNKNEYYLLENRQPVGFDKGLFGHGMLILHVDYSESAWESNKVNSTAGHERMTIIPADNEFSQNSLQAFQGDPWPGIKGNTMLGNNTTPAATLYNANIDGRKLMSKQIDNIKEDVEAMTISFVACRPEMDVPQTDGATEHAEGTSVTISWPEVSGAIGYEIELTAKDKAATNPQDALQREYTFDKFYSEKPGFSDIGKKLSDYGLNGWSGEKLYTSPNKLKMGTTSSNGILTTPTWQVPSSSDITLVMGAESGKTSTSGSIAFQYANEGDQYWSNGESQKFTVTGKEMQVIHFDDVRADDFRLRFLPEGLMYLNYVAIYDGNWTAEQLGINNSPAQAPRRAVTTNIYSSTTNSYTFTDLTDKKTYSYRLRAMGEEGTYSAWSQEKALQYGSTGIHGIFSESTDNAPVRYFDMQGREVTGQTKGLLIRKQGNSVKKVIVQ